MWCEGRHNNERLPRKRGTPWSLPRDGYHSVLNMLGRKPSLLKNPPLLVKKPPLLGKPGEASYIRHDSLTGYQDYDKGRSFSHDRRSGPPQRGDECENQCSRYNHSVTHHIHYRDMGPSSHYMRDQFPLKRDPTFLGRSPVGQKFSLHNRFVPTAGNRSYYRGTCRSYSPIRSKVFYFHEARHRRKPYNEIFGKVEKKSIDKGPFLDKCIHFALRQNSPEIGVQCVGEQLKHSISEYDTQDFKRHDIWSEGQYDCERLSRDQEPTQSHPKDDYHRVINIVPRKIPLIGRKAPLLEKKPALLEKKPLLPPVRDRPDKESCNKYYSFAGYQEYNKGCTFCYDQRSVPPQKGDESGYRWSRYNHSANHQSYYRSKCDSYRRKSFHSSHYMKDQSPHTKKGSFDPTFFGESLLDRKDSPVSSRRHFIVQGKTSSFQKSQHRGNERKVHSLKTSRCTPFSSSEAAPSSKVLDKPRRLSEKELDEAVRRWAAKNCKTSEESELSGISEFKVVPMTPLFSKQPQAPGTDAPDSTEAHEDNQRSRRFKSISLKAKEVKQVYQQYSEIFGKVVRMLIQKDPSLEKSIQFALRQNLQEIGEQCVRELEDFIAEYDASEDFGESS